MSQLAGDTRRPTASAFFPDGGRARKLDARMRAELAKSLAYITDEVRAQCPGTAVAAGVGKLSPVIAALRRDRRRARPAIFSAYYRLVECLTRDADAAADVLTDLIAAAEPPPGFRFTVFDSEALGGPRVLNLYRQALDTDSLQSFDFDTPGPADFERARASVSRALDLMRRTAPALAAEFEALVIEVVFAAGSRVPGSVRFDGASSYQLWGALALNVDERKSDLEMMETLAHEAGHSFLFGMTIDEPLVFNADEELYQSPLRRDPRPMDGIYHATFVAARMHYAMTVARDSGCLSGNQMSQCEGFLRASRRAFEDGDSVVSAHGDLSPTGAALMDDTRRFMVAAGASASS